MTREATNAAVKSAEAAEKALAREHEADAHSKRALARSLYLELSRQAARCCYDGERGWSALRNSEAVEVLRLRKFVPDDPIIFKTLADRLADLPGDAATSLLAFYYRVDAQRRDTENAASAAIDDYQSLGPRVFAGSPKVSGADLRMLVRRHDEALPAALEALTALGPSVDDAEQIDARSIASFDSVTPNTAAAGTLRDRMHRLIREREVNEPSNDFEG